MPDRRTLMSAAALGAFGLTSQTRAQSDDPKLQVDVSVCFDSGTLLWVPLRLKGIAPGLMHRPLRRLDDGSLRSAIVRVPAGWNSGGAVKLRQRLQIYVISGEIQLGTTALKKDAYLLEHPGRTMSRLSSSGGAELLLVSDGRPEFDAPGRGAENEGAIVVLQVPQDKSTRLWDDPATGATMSLLRVPPGWTSPGPEYHPCQEEILCLTGDIAPDNIRILKPGWFLWNPPYGVHGFHLHSTAGGTVLEWHDARWAKLIFAGELPPA
jgi:hypothetical protein